LVAKGRKEFLQQFKTIACAEAASVLSDPAAEQTFLRSKLDFSERETHSEIYALHRDLLRLRREDPVFANPRAGGLDGAVLGPEAFVLRFFSEDGKDRLLLINLGLDLDLTPAPEPLLAPPGEADWSILWSSEAPCYGGGGTPPLPGEGSWRLLGHAAVVLQPKPRGGS
jgi:maltooligosyltrehalose trehalohydrolase